ncbi:MAG: hypothetical protein KJZ69_00005, partial [Phycisphaerales bacterium]|nr:hypothetical protein [Phycisphaerales bacterium]
VSFTTTGSGGSTIHGPDNPIAWDGCVFNAETSQYLVRFRWYDPLLGRWLERDPIGYASGMSLYEAFFLAPSQWTDPLGLDPDVWHWHHMIPRGYEAMFAACNININSPEFGLVMKGSDHMHLNSRWTPEFDAWLDTFRSTHGRLPDYWELRRQCATMRKSPKYAQWTVRGFRTKMGYKAWSSTKKAARAARDDLLWKLALKYGKRTPKRWARGFLPGVSLFVAFIDRPARAETYGQGNSWWMTVGDCLPYVDNAIIGAELIEQYLEERRQIERNYVRDMNALFADAGCEPCDQAGDDPEGDPDNGQAVQPGVDDQDDQHSTDEGG